MAIPYPGRYTQEMIDYIEGYYRKRLKNRLRRMELIDFGDEICVS